MSLALLIIIWHDAIVEILAKLTICGITNMSVYQRKPRENSLFGDYMTPGSVPKGLE
jgi:L-rhamnose mutarotase